MLQNLNLNFDRLFFCSIKMLVFLWNKVKMLWEM